MSNAALPPMPADLPSRISALVAEFNRKPASGYSEDDIGRMLLRLFMLLGWDSFNPIEVSGQESIGKGRSDYGFYLNGQPVFYLEVKKADRSLDSTDFVRQAIRYAWLRGVRWAVLSNFQRLRLFIAETVPAKDQENKAWYLIDLRADAYAAQAADLWLLSKPMFASRALDTEARRHGRLAQAKDVQSVKDVLSKQFIAERTTLTDVLHTVNPDQDHATIEGAVQRLIDRCIFLRTMEDRGVEAEDPDEQKTTEPDEQEEPDEQKITLRELVRQHLLSKNTLPAALKSHFSRMNEIYDSNLFEPSAIDTLSIPDTSKVRLFINRLYDVPGMYAEYDFSAIGVDVLGQVYEDYLATASRDGTRARSTTGWRVPAARPNVRRKRSTLLSARSRASSTPRRTSSTTSSRRR